MAKHFLRFTVAISFFLGLVGCSCIHDRFGEYRGSCNRPPLVVPPCIHPCQLGDDMTIPDACECDQAPLMLPPESLALQVAQGKLSKKALKKVEFDTRRTCVAWTQNKYGMPALKTNKALPGTWSHVERALKQLSPLYRIQHKDEALGTFYIYDLAATKGKVCPTTPVYQLRLMELDDGTMISLSANTEETILPEDIIHRVLNDLRQALESTKEGLSLKQWLFGS